MAIVISGVNNNDKITASDGTIDLLSGVSYASTITAPDFTTPGKITATSINVGDNIQVGNAGIITATTLIGNVTGNINHTSNLLLQISGSEKFRVGTSGQLGIGGANYGTSGQVLTSGGSGSAATWSTINSDAINEGNTKAEVIDSGSDGRFIVETEGTQRIRIDSNGLGISTTTTSVRNTGVGTAIGTIIFNSTENQLQVYDNKLAWKGFSPLDPTLTNISGNVYAGLPTTLTLTGTNFLTTNLQINFLQATRSVDVTVTVTPSSNTAASVAVPASVYNNVQNGDALTIKVINSDGGISDGLNINVSALPTGGNITTSGSSRIHTFTSSGTFVVPSGLTLNNVEYLVVGGGGGGGPSNNGHQGGGGGAGGLRTSVVGATSGRNTSAESRLTYTAGSYSVSVGAGGASKSQSGGGYGSSGVQSSLATTGSAIVSSGGGGGGRGQNDGASRGGLNGGCGGGAASSDQSPAVGGSGTAGQGYDGGQPTCTGCGRGAAGGGAGSAGTNGGSGGVGGSNTAGGAGLANDITGSSVTYATGGDCPGTNCDQNPGAANTGNGGDSGYSNGCSTTGQAGGSGIVILRYVV